MSKKPIKLLSLAAVAALSLVVLAGCGPKEADPAETMVPSPSQVVETQAPVETPDEAPAELPTDIPMDVQEDAGEPVPADPTEGALSTEAS